MKKQHFLGWLLFASLPISLGCSSQSSSGMSPEGGASSGGAPASSGGASSSGGTSVTGGESGSSGGASSGGSLDTARFSTEFASLEGFSVASKSELLPGATATIESDVDAKDGNVLVFEVPGDSSLGSTDFEGPGAHAIEVVAGEEARLYGRYEFTVKFPVCGSGEEMVAGLFTYFNDGSDLDEDEVADNSEIDIEHLCGEPQNLWFTVWTDYESTPSEAFRRTSRLIDMRTGDVKETPLGGSSWGGLEPAGKLDLAIADFPKADTYYTLGFEWRETFVSYYFLDGAKKVELWRLEGKDYVPQRSARLLMNLWHPGTHWASGGAADFPAANVALRVDSVRFYD